MIRNLTRILDYSRFWTTFFEGKKKNRSQKLWQPIFYLLDYNHFTLCSVKLRSTYVTGSFSTLHGHKMSVLRLISIIIGNAINKVKNGKIMFNFLNKKLLCVSITCFLETKMWELNNSLSSIMLVWHPKAISTSSINTAKTPHWEQWSLWGVLKMSTGTLFHWICQIRSVNLISQIFEMSQTIFGLGLGKNGEFKWFVWDSVLCRKLLQTEICFNRLSPSIKSINDTMLMTIDSTWFL